MGEPRPRKTGIPNRPVADDLAESILPPPEHEDLTAYDFRDELQGILGWTDDELHSLPICYGSDLVLGEVYFDLDHPERGEFRATEEATINPGCRYVSKRAVPERLWYRLAATAGNEELPSGNAAPTPGAFGAPKGERIRTSRGETPSAPEEREAEG